VNKILGGGDCSVGFFAVPLRVRQDVRTVLAFHDAWVFAAARPFPFPLRIIIGVENRLRPASEVDAIGAFGETQSGSVHANAHFAGVILRPVEQVNLTVPHNGRRIECVQSLPVDRLPVHRVPEQRILVRRNHRIPAGRARKWANLPPVGLIRRNSGRPKPCRNEDEH